MVVYDFMMGLWWVYDGFMMGLWWVSDGLWWVSDGFLMGFWWVYGGFLVGFWWVSDRFMMGFWWFMTGSNLKSLRIPPQHLGSPSPSSKEGGAVAWMAWRDDRRGTRDELNLALDGGHSYRMCSSSVGYKKNATNQIVDDCRWYHIVFKYDYQL